MKVKHLMAIILGLLSGGLTAYAPAEGFGNPSIRPILLFPGLFFGLAGCVYFSLIFKRSQWIGYIGWVAVSIVAYNVAYWMTFLLVLAFGVNTSSERLLLPGAYLGFFVGGFLGSFLTLLGLKWTIVKLKMKEILILSFGGGVLGLAGVFSSEKDNYALLFLIWQAGMMFLIMTRADKYLTVPDNQLQ